MVCVLYIDDLFTRVQGTCLRFPHHISFPSLSRCHQTRHSLFPLTPPPSLLNICHSLLLSMFSAASNLRANKPGREVSERSLCSKHRQIFPLFLKADYKHTTHKYTLLQSHHHIWVHKNANTHTHSQSRRQQSMSASHSSISRLNNVAPLLLSNQ